jgi:hypothetical protein
MDDDQLKNGCSMVIDPFGDVLAECRTLGNDIAIATCTHEKITHSGAIAIAQPANPSSTGTSSGQSITRNKESPG